MNEERIYTSRPALLEVVVISDRFEFDRTEPPTHALEIGAVPEDEDVLFRVTDYVESDEPTAFEAYHVIDADEDRIISSDNAFGGVTDDRIAIEEIEAEQPVSTDRRSDGECELGRCILPGDSSANRRSLLAASGLPLGVCLEGTSCCHRDGRRMWNHLGYEELEY